MVRTSSPSGLERPGEPEELRGREAHALGAARHGFAERHRTARHRHHSRDALLVQGLEVRAFCDAACEHDDGRAVRTGRHRTDELAARRLVVDHALARHDEVRIGRKGGEVHQVKKRIAPDRSLPLRKATTPAPQPPAAPAQGMSASFGPLLRSKIVARCAMPAFIVSTISGVAPFGGRRPSRSRSGRTGDSSRRTAPRSSRRSQRRTD